MNKIQRIQKLKAKIAKLQEDSGDDIFMSLREAVQTEDMLNLMQKQLKAMEHLEDGETIAVYDLKSSSGEEIKIHIVNNHPDPKNLVITENTPIGKQLLSSKVGDTVGFRNDDYEIIEIN